MSTTTESQTPTESDGVNTEQQGRADHRARLAAEREAATALRDEQPFDPATRDTEKGVDAQSEPARVSPLDRAMIRLEALRQANDGRRDPKQVVQAAKRFAEWILE